MAIHAIAAITANQVMGVNGDLPWKFGTQKADMKRFRQLTEHNIVIMGSKTYESMGKKALKNRFNIVISRNIAYRVDGETILAANPIKAFQLAKDLHDSWLASDNFSMKCFIIGGAEIYKEFLELDAIDVFHMTYMASVYPITEDDSLVMFPGLPKWPEGWKEQDEEVHQQSEGNLMGYRFVDLIRVRREDNEEDEESHDDNGWIRCSDGKPTEYGKYEVYRAGCKKQQYQTWNNTGWAYDNRDITHWRPIVPPTTQP
jgi:dihydrofolate reductase